MCCCQPKEGQQAQELAARKWTTPIFIFGAIQFLGFFSGSWQGGLAGVLCVAAGVMVLSAHPGRAGATNYLTASILLSLVILIDLISIIVGFVYIMWLNGINCSEDDGDLGESEERVCDSRGGVRTLRTLVIVAIIFAFASVALLSAAASKCLRARDFCMRQPIFADRYQTHGMQLHALQGMPAGGATAVAVAVPVADSTPVHAVQGVAVPVQGPPDAGALGIAVHGSAVAPGSTTSTRAPAQAVATEPHAQADYNIVKQPPV